MARLSTFALLILAVSGCTSGITALRHGDYDAAVAKAAHRYKQKPTHKHARFVLEEAFQLAYNRHQQTIQAISRSREPFRWEKAVTAYEQLQKTTDIARQSGLTWAEQYPADYAQNLAEVRQLAAADRYEVAEQAYPHHQESLEAARDAYEQYGRANNWVPGYRDATAKAAEVLPYAILRVVMEPLTPSPEIDQSEGRDLQREIARRVGQRSAPSPFVRIYLNDPDSGEGYPIHQHVQLVVSNYQPQREDISHSSQTVESNEAYVVGKKKINDSTTVLIKEKVKGVLTTHRRELVARMDLRIRAVDRTTGRVAWENELTRHQRWETQWQTFVGDTRALNGHSLTTASIFVPSASRFFDDLIDDLADDVRSELRNRYD